MKRNVTVAALCLSFLMPQPAAATQQYISSIEQVPGAPITVSGCVGQLDQTLISIPEFTNVAQQTIVAVEFKVAVYDAFDAKLDTLTFQRAGEFAPGVAIRIKRIFGVPTTYDCLYVSPNAAKTTCSVDRVKYADGTLWTAPGITPA